MEDKVVVCNRCLCKVYPSCLDEYAYQCLEHDEDLYSIETHILNKNVYLHMMADRINCPIEKIEQIHDEYDVYVMQYYIHDAPVEAPMTLKEYYESSLQQGTQQFPVSMEN